MNRLLSDDKVQEVQTAKASVHKYRRGGFAAAESPVRSQIPA